MEVLFAADRIFDGTTMHEGMALAVAGGQVAGIVPGRSGAIDLGHVLLAPGFIDWQVNGGGGELFNANPSVAGLRRIAETHARFGVTGFLPTLITSTEATQERGAEAVAEAIAEGLEGVVGIHFEGPNLSGEKHGMHDAALMHPLTGSEIARIGRPDLGKVVVTLAPEINRLADIRALAGRGVIVSLGHSAATFEEASAAFDAGARAVTHLFNAMSGLHHRAPGLVGAVLTRPDVYAGLIADGHHVHPAAMAPFLHPSSIQRMSLVSDAMATVGSDLDGFDWNGAWVSRSDGRLSLADGTLAGADTDIAGCLRYVVQHCGVALTDALCMASATPAAMLEIEDRGHLRTGARADFVTLDADLQPVATYSLGRKIADRFADGAN